MRGAAFAALALGSAVGAVAAVTSVTALAGGCNTAKLSTGPDASPDCTPKAEYPCEAGAAVGCGPLANPKSQVELNFTIDASYPLGCTILVDDPTPDDSNQCVQLGSCRCDSDDSGTLAWRCLPP